MSVQKQRRTEDKDRKIVSIYWSEMGALSIASVVLTVRKEIQILETYSGLSWLEKIREWKPLYLIVEDKNDDIKLILREIKGLSKIHKITPLSVLAVRIYLESYDINWSKFKREKRLFEELNSGVITPESFAIAIALQHAKTIKRNSNHRASYAQPKSRFSDEGGRDQGLYRPHQYR